MAKRKAAAKGTSVVVVRQPAAPKPAKRAPYRKRGPSRKKARSTGLTVIKKRAYDERHKLVAVGAALALGIAEKQGINLPHIEKLGVAGTYGLAAFLLSKPLKSTFLDQLATGFLSVSLYKLGASGFETLGEDPDEMPVYAGPEEVVFNGDVSG